MTRLNGIGKHSILSLIDKIKGGASSTFQGQTKSRSLKDNIMLTWDLKSLINLSRQLNGDKYQLRITDFNS